MARRRPRHAAPPRIDPRAATAATAVILTAVLLAAGTVHFAGAGAAVVQPPLGPGASEDAIEAADEPADRTLTVTGTGDILLGSAPDLLPPGDAEGFFDRAAASLDGDLLIGNFEGALTDIKTSAKCGKPPAKDCGAFRMPPAYARVLADAGFDVLNLANNHALDYGENGLTDTQDHLNEAGVEYTGMQGQYAEIVIGDIGVAVIGVSPYSWSQDVHDIDGTARLVEAAGERNDLVIVTMQAGAEGKDKDHVVSGEEVYLGENRGDVTAFSHAVIDAGADLVIGHGPHVLRGMEFYKDKLIAYSLGNFAGYGVLSGEGNRGIGATIAVTLTIDGDWVEGTLHSTCLVDGGYPADDPDNAAQASVNALSTEDFGDTAALVTDGGLITPP